MALNWGVYKWRIGTNFGAISSFFCTICHVYGACCLNVCEDRPILSVGGKKDSSMSVAVSDLKIMQKLVRRTINDS